MFGRARAIGGEVLTCSTRRIPLSIRRNFTDKKLIQFQPQQQQQQKLHLHPPPPPPAGLSLVGAKGQVRHHNLGTASYEGDGKTTVTILNHEIDSPLMIDTYNERGFRLNNGMVCVGPIALFPKTVLGWDVGSTADINEESLSLFGTLEPKLDILVIGFGSSGSGELSPQAYQYLRSKKIAVEALPTQFAIHMFNFLNVEKRCVAAALIPPGVVTHGYLDEELRERLRRKKLYEVD